MAKIFITGSADGIGALAAQDLCSRGHQVYLHARSAQRASDAMRNCPQAQKCFVADLSRLSEVQRLARELGSEAPLDCVIHNAGVMRGMSGMRAPDAEYGLLFATNTLAPYVVSTLLGGKARRHVFLGSSMHVGGDGKLKGLENCGYGDSKLHNVMLALGFARRFRGTDGVEEVNAVDPGWVPTKMGGAGASDDIKASVQTYVKLAEGAGSSGEYWGPGARKGWRTVAAATDVDAQDRLFDELEKISGIRAPQAQL